MRECYGHLLIMLSEYRNKIHRTLTRSSVISTDLPAALQFLQDQLLSQHSSLEEFENSIPVTVTLCFFSFKILLMTSLAILLNVGWYQKSSRMMKAACIFLFFFGIEIVWIMYAALEWATTQDTAPMIDGIRDSDDASSERLSIRDEWKQADPSAISRLDAAMIKE